jgi:hypothetical protein
MRLPADPHMCGSEQGRMRPCLQVHFEVRNEVAYGRMWLWIMVGHAAKPGTSIPGFPFVLNLNKAYWVAM